MWSAHNKKELVVLENFFSALVSTSKTPAQLSADASDLMKLIRADVDNVMAVKSILDNLGQPLACFLVII